MKPETNTIYYGDALVVMKDWPAGCVDCVITSIPYWGLRSYSWGGDKACKHKWADLDETYQGCTCGARRPRYGIEPTLEEYLAKTVEIFREVRRVLKPWGTLWLNVGDVYIGGGCGQGQTAETGSPKQKTNKGSYTGKGPGVDGLASGNRLMLPARVALALQADGWVLRSEIIWVKGWSFHDCNGRHITQTGTDLFGDPYEDVVVDEPDYVGSTMPESVNGWRWTRHKVKIKEGKGQHRDPNRCDIAPSLHVNIPTIWQDCPGCKVCEPNGGLVLRKGNWRPTKAHEQMFLLSKPGRYYCDAEAVKEDAQYGRSSYFRSGIYENNAAVENNSVEIESKGTNRGSGEGGRNLRDCWCINPQPFGGAHFATFPEKLCEAPIKAGTSEKGNCPRCGMPWTRVIDSKGGTLGKSWHDHAADDIKGQLQSRPDIGRAQDADGETYSTTTLGWRASCRCNAGEPVPAVVLDAFMGSGTVGLVAERLGRNWLGIEINPEYVAMAEKRLSKDKTLLEK